MEQLRVQKYSYPEVYFPSDAFPQSAMGRRLLLAEIKLDKNEILRIGTVHLESLNNKQERLSQLNICQNVFSRSPGTCILMGDFNFRAHGQENIDAFSINLYLVSLAVVKHPPDCSFP